MKVIYRANSETADLADDAARQLVAARICDAAAEPPKEPAKKDPPPKKSDKPDKSTKVEPMTTEDMPVPTKQVT